jgi:endonuclease YncB( thermonuclease family)
MYWHIRPPHWQAWSAMAGLAYLLAFTAQVKDFTGIASKIVDGDTLYVCNESVCEKVRLCGIDAPERADARDPVATAALKAVALSKTLRCVCVDEGSVCDGRSKPTNRDRIVAQCFEREADISAEMVERLMSTF